MAVLSPEEGVPFEAPTEFVLPDLRSVVGRTGPLPEVRMRTTYVDTPEHRLWERGITLCHRASAGNGRGSWTLQLPAAGRARGSDGRAAPGGGRVVHWDGGRRAIPPEAQRMVQGLVRRRPLREVAELHTLGRRLALYDGEGEAGGGRLVGEIADDTITVAGGAKDGTRLRRVRLELGTRGDALRRAVVDELAQAGATAGAGHELATVLGPSGPPPRPALHRSSSIGDVVRATVGSALDQLLALDWRLRASAPDLAPADVHRARVAARRLRADLKLLASALDPLWVRHTRRELRWVRAVLGDVRDADVLAGDLAGGAAALGPALAAQRRAAAERVGGMLGSGRYLDLLDRLHAASEAPPFAVTGPVAPDDPAGDVLPAMVGERWGALRRRVGGAPAMPSDHRLHRIRITAKRLRYAAETAVPVVGAPARRTAALAEDLQDVLGEHRDATRAERWLRAWALNPPPSEAGATAPGPTPPAVFEAGMLAAGQRLRQERAARRWTARWDRLDRKKVRRWLG